MKRKWLGLHSIHNDPLTTIREVRFDPTKCRSINPIILSQTTDEGGVVDCVESRRVIEKNKCGFETLVNSE